MLTSGNRGALVLFSAFLFTLGAVVGNCGGSIARGSFDLTEEILLARLCVNEGDTRAYGLDDCVSIDAVIEFRAEHIYHSSYIEALHRYSRGVTIRRSPNSTRPWIADLLPSAVEPIGWTPRARWQGRHSVWWSRTYRHAVEIRRNEVQSSCQPHTWGAATLLPPDTSAHVVDCGETRNVFWSVPSYADRWGGS